MKRSTFLKLGVTTLLFPAGACSPAPMPVSQSSKDPSSPTAASGMNPLFAASSAPRASTSSSTSGADGVVYVCPMHPEVTSTVPDSVCPKCNMKLVPKK